MRRPSEMHLDPGEVLFAERSDLFYVVLEGEIRSSSRRGGNNELSSTSLAVYWVSSQCLTGGPP